MDTSAEQDASTTPETHLTWKEYKNARCAKAIDRLRKGGLNAGDTIYVILRHVGKTRATSYYDLYTIRDKKPDCITWDAGIVLDKSYSRDRAAIRVNRSDSEAGRDLIRDLAQKVFGRPDELDCCILEP